MRNPHTGAETSALLPGGRRQYKSFHSMLSKETWALTCLKTCILRKLFSIVPTVAATTAAHFEKPLNSSLLKREDWMSCHRLDLKWGRHVEAPHSVMWVFGGGVCTAETRRLVLLRPRKPKPTSTRGLLHFVLQNADTAGRTSQHVETC